MAPKKSNKSTTKRESKPGGKNGKKGSVSGSSFLTWFVVIALLGVWTSVAVVWFDLVDYEEVLGKLEDYDTDGDGDFDMDDAKVFLGLTKDGSSVNIDSLEEVLNILAEESSDWFYGFLSFLYDVMTPFEMLEEEEQESTDDVDGFAPEEVAKKEIKKPGEEPGGIAKTKPKAEEKVKEGIKEQLKKTKEKILVQKKEPKVLEKKKAKKETKDEAKKQHEEKKAKEKDEPRRKRDEKPKETARRTTRGKTSERDSGKKSDKNVSKGSKVDDKRK